MSRNLHGAPRRPQRSSSGSRARVRSGYVRIRLARRDSPAERPRGQARPPSRRYRERGAHRSPHVAGRARYTRSTSNAGVRAPTAPRSAAAIQKWTPPQSWRSSPQIVMRWPLPGGRTKRSRTPLAVMKTKPQKAIASTTKLSAGRLTSARTSSSQRPAGQVALRGLTADVDGGVALAARATEEVRDAASERPFELPGAPLVARLGRAGAHARAGHD